jgi:hypothetical protein
VRGGGGTHHDGRTTSARPQRVLLGPRGRRGTTRRKTGGVHVRGCCCHAPCPALLLAQALGGEARAALRARRVEDEEVDELIVQETATIIQTDTGPCVPRGSRWWGGGGARGSQRGRVRRRGDRSSRRL